MEITPIKRLSASRDKRLRINHYMYLQTAVYYHSSFKTEPCFRVFFGNFKSPWAFDAYFSICDDSNKPEVLKINIENKDMDLFIHKVEKWIDRRTSLFSIPRYTNREKAIIAWNELNPHNPIALAGFKSQMQLFD